MVITPAPVGPPERGHGLPPRVKVVLLGASGVGKSSLALRYVHRTFDPGSRATVGAAFFSVTVTPSAPGGAPPTKFEIWDTAGQERYQALAPLYYRGAHGAVVVYDVTQRDSLDKAQHWMGELRRFAGSAIALVLVANKTDLAGQRQVTEQEGQDTADRCGAVYVEASAATGARVDEVFDSLAAQLAGGLPVSSNAIAATPAPQFP